MEKRSYKMTRVQRSGPTCRSAESVAWIAHVKLTSLPSHPSSADFTTSDGQSLILLALFLDICELPVMHFIWGLFGLSLVQYLLKSHKVTVESNFNVMHSSLFKT